MKKFFKMLYLLWKTRGMYVILDGRDSSVTLSKRLFKSMNVFDEEDAKVMMFRVGNEFAFMLNPPIEQETQLAEIQYNQKHKCIGFESLVPTVNRILYDYGLHPEHRIRLSVEKRWEQHMRKYYYTLIRPRI
jgi:hypothetical protein